MSAEPRALAAKIRAGHPAALGRGISLIENEPEMGADLLRELGGQRRGLIIGITGPPGAGKSTLVSRLVLAARAERRTVGAILVDPSSPFGGGSVLGDRYRMVADVARDRDVFVRSMGTRGALGGLATATARAARLLSAAGKDVVFVETVGVGQSEVEIAAAADLVLLVLQPGTGDAVQADKAGVMEIADILVVNKADHPDAGLALQTLRQALRASPRERQPAIHRTVAESGGGVAELWQAICEIHRKRADAGELQARRMGRIEREVAELVANALRIRVGRAASEDADLRAMLNEVTAGSAEIEAVAERIVDRLWASMPPCGGATK